MQTKETLEVVDENDVAIGLEDRETIHKCGLLHKEVHVIFITPQKEIIFQHREKDKSSWPDKLDATAGGHVDPGESYEAAAIREAKEETGVEIKVSDLVPLGKIRTKIAEPGLDITNNVTRFCFAYLYTGALEELQIEKGKIIEFVKYQIDSLVNLLDQEKAKFIPERLGNKYMEMYKEAVVKLNI